MDAAPQRPRVCRSRRRDSASLACSQREDGGVGPDIGVGDGLEKINAILPGQVGYRYDLSFSPQDVVGKGGDVRHVYPRAHDAPAFANGAKSLRHQRPDWRVNDRGIQFGRRSVL